MDVANAPRAQLKINCRKGLDFVYRGMRKALNTQSGSAGSVICSVLFYPSVKDKETLADLVNRAAWYLPVSSLSRVIITIPLEASLLNVEIKSLGPPASQQNYIGESDNVEFVNARDVNLSKYDMILIWNKRSILDPRIWRFLNRTRVVDPTYFSVTESATYQGLYSEVINNGEKKRLIDLSRNNYKSLLDRVSGYSKGFVFGTGPSLERAMGFDYSQGFRVICNSTVKNRVLLDHIKPHLLVFADPVFHFSPCRYSDEFRRMVVETVERYQCYIMVPEKSLPLYFAHYSDLESKIIGMSVNNKKFNFPSPDKFYVKSSDNIMTMLMIPVVSSVARDIFIIGADGRRPEDKYFWQHSSMSQFCDLMQTAYDTHPSFFRDRVYSKYYEEHCQLFNELIFYGESLGKRYFTLTPSHIPVLAQRLAQEGK